MRKLFAQKRKTIEEKHRRRYRFFQIGFFLLLLTLGLTVYLNYDYWVFKLLIADSYIFTDTMDGLYRGYIGDEYEYRRDFDRVVMSVMTEKIRSLNNDRYTYLYTPQEYEYAKAAEKADAKMADMETLSVDTAYMYLPNISTLTRDFVYDNKERLSVYPNLVLDLRGNYGGLLNDFYRIADLFVEKDTVLGYEQTRVPFLTHAVKAKSERYFNFDSIIILQDKNTASAAEGLIQALKHHVPGVTLAGGATFGKGIGQVTIPLTGGYAIRGTVLLVQGPDGGSIHQKGIAPDVVINTEGEDAIAAAVGLIN